MENKKKKDLAKIALAAFMLSASLPVAGHASTDAQAQGTYLAAGCGAASNRNTPANSGCGASSGRYSPAHSGCGASSQRSSPATSGCGASSQRSSPATSGCGASSQRYSPASSGCGATPRTYNNGPATHACGAAGDEEVTPTPTPPKNNMNNKPKSVAMRDSSGMNRPSNNMGSMDDSGMSSYQGTTTGPGPNDGYPATPRGSYDANQKPGR